MEGVTFRRHIDAARVARILFINRGNTSLHVVVNDSLERDFRPDPSPLAQQIVINGPVRTIAVTLSDPEGFVGYGIELECPDGVTVDNFSIRGKQRAGAVRDPIRRSMRGSANCSATIWSCCSTG